MVELRTMTPREQRRVFGSVLAMALVLLGLLMLLASGCATGARKALSVVTAATEAAVVVARKECRALAETRCTTNPCPPLATCHEAEADLALAAAAATRGARKLNKVLP